MKLEEFDYDLPAELIAAHPCAERTQSRLLVVNDANNFRHLHFYDVLQLIKPADILVLNTTKVIKARLFGNKESGGKIECLIERIIDDRTAWAHIRSSKSPKPGSNIIINNTTIAVPERTESLFCLRLPEGSNWDAFLDQHGSIPLPPYIERELMPDDEDRYQTVFAKEAGAVAAPTAGLHFSTELLAAIRNQGTQIAEVTLHVGAGTFQTVRSENIEDHVMHQERIEVSEECIAMINQAKANGGRVIAVGTTVLRALESAAQTGELKPIKGETDLFIYPGKAIHIIDCLITNFHLPKSSLLMLVSALAGTATIRSAYTEAIKEKYRFFSYGDAMWLYRN